MKFNLYSDSEKVVQLTLERDQQGDIELLANGYVLLWIRTNGSILRSSTIPDELRKIGFNINADDVVELEGE